MRELLIALCLIVSIPAHAGCKDISDPRTCDEEGLDEWYPDRDKRSSLQRLKDSSKEFIHEQAQKGRFERCMEDYKDEGYCGQFRD